MIVTKFGGSSLSDAAQFEKVRRILEEDPERRVTVVSAPGKRSKDDIKVTDLLYRCCEAAEYGEDFEPVLSLIRARFMQIIEALGLVFDLEPELERIRGHLLSAPSRDYMASRGEYLNAQLMAAFLHWRFLDAADVVRFSPSGAFMEEETDRLLRAALSSGEPTVLPGFYGASEDGTVFTFSRGGSDITGALAARAADAKVYENWTDVSGMLFTDPRIVPDPRPIPVITYYELRELSYMGASVLHENAVFPVRRAGIPIHINNTNRPHDPGTWIVPSLPEEEKTCPVTGVAGKRGFTNVHIEKALMNTEIGFGAQLMEIFASCGIPFEHCPTGIDTISLVVPGDLFEKNRDRVLAEVQRRLQPDVVRVEPGMAMIAVVGRGMVRNRGIAARIFSAITASGVNIRMIDQGSGELNIILGVDDAEYEAAVRGLYREFCG